MLHSLLKSVVRRSLVTMSVAAAAMASCVVTPTPVAADVVYETNSPFGGFFFFGFDLYPEQRVAVRFTPEADFSLDRLGVWLMNNDFDGGLPSVTITLRSDAPGAKSTTIPSETIIESWTFNITAVGWDPQLEYVDSVLHPVLEAGTNYWIVAESQAPALFNPVWSSAANDSGYLSICNGSPCEWISGEGAIAACVVEGTPILDCPADTNNDGNVNVTDLLAVISAWGQTGDNPADVSGDGIVNVTDLLAVISDWGDC